MIKPEAANENEEQRKNYLDKSNKNLGRKLTFYSLFF